MRKVLIVAIASLGLMATACTKATQEKASEDTKAAAQKTGDAIKDVAGSPEMKSVGADIKTAAAETADAAKDVAGQAKVAGKDIAADVKKNTAEAKAKVESDTRK